MATAEVNNSHVMVLNFTKYFNLYTAILRIFIYSKHKIIHSKRPKDRILSHIHKIFCHFAVLYMIFTSTH